MNTLDEFEVFIAEIMYNLLLLITNKLLSQLPAAVQLWCSGDADIPYCTVRNS